MSANAVRTSSIRRAIIARVSDLMRRQCGFPLVRAQSASFSLAPVFARDCSPSSRRWGKMPPAEDNLDGGYSGAYGKIMR